MTEQSESADKVHYICQTYVEKKEGNGTQAGLKIGKQLQYTIEADAQNRAEREFERDDCVGADAYMIVEDSGSGEVSAPTFIARLGIVPEADDF